MTKKALLVGVSVSVLSLFSAPALADKKDDRIKALEAQIQMLAKEVQALKEDSAAEKEEAKAELKAAAEQAVAQAVQNIEPAAGHSDVKITMAPSPKIQSGDFSWQPFGRIHLDTAVFNDDVADHPNGSEFRRARLGMKGTVAKDFPYKVEVDFANEGVNFKDVYLGYTGIDNTMIRIGSIKPGFSLEEMTSANYITFIERSAPTSAFTTSEIIGADIATHGDMWSLAAGIFNDDTSVGSADDEAWSANLRGTAAIVNNDHNTLHLGAAASHRKPDQAGDTFDFDARAENAVQSLDSVSANFANADSADLYGLELAGVFGPLSLQGEYYKAEVDRHSGNNDVEFDGAYVQGAWTITGERRPYTAASGKFGRIVPENPVGDGGWGAWELAARYSTLDVTDDTVLGGEMDSYTLGLNWYLNKHVRLMANYIDADTDQNAVTADDDPQLLLFRSQIDF